MPRTVRQAATEAGISLSTLNRARDLVAATGKRQARKRLASYRALADDEKLAQRDRAVAAQRAHALAGLLG